MGPRPLSGLQKQIIALYRKCLRKARAVDPERLKGHEAYIRAEFRKNCKDIERSEFNRIEHEIRKGERQLKLLSTPGISGSNFVAQTGSK